MPKQLAARSVKGSFKIKWSSYPSPRTSALIVFFKVLLIGQLLRQPGRLVAADPQLKGHLPEDGAARSLPEAQFVEQPLRRCVAVANLGNKSVDVLGHKKDLGKRASLLHHEEAGFCANSL